MTTTSTLRSERLHERERAEPKQLHPWTRVVRLSADLWPRLELLLVWLVVVLAASLAWYLASLMLLAWRL